jgi:hypothetical protein
VPRAPAVDPGREDAAQEAGGAPDGVGDLLRVHRRYGADGSAPGCGRLGRCAGKEWLRRLLVSNPSVMKLDSQILRRAKSAFYAILVDSQVDSFGFKAPVGVCG